jgi:pilus assembly protein CpaB
MAARTRSLVLLFVAIAAGGAAAWLALGYLRRQAQPLLNVAASPGHAVVAARDLPVGTIIQAEDIRLVDWPGDAIPPGMQNVPEDVIGRGLITGLRLNEPILESEMAPKGVGGGLKTLITEGMRALSIRVDDVVGVSGFVVPGTRVDVLLTTSTGTPTNEPTTRAILQNIQALAAGQTIQLDPQGKPMQVPVITVLVSPEQAETLALASSQGRIQLTLRNALDTLVVKTPGARASTLMALGRGPAPVGTGYRRVATPRPTTETTIIEGFRGAERTVTRFTRPRPPQEPPDQ